MAFGFFGRRRRKDREDESFRDSAAPGTPEAAAEVPGDEGHGQERQGRLSPADLLPDANLPQLNRSRATILRGQLEKSFADADAHIDIDGASAEVVTADGLRFHISLRTLAMNAASLDDFDQLPELVHNFVQGALWETGVDHLSTAQLYKSVRLRLLPTPVNDDAVSDDIEDQIRDDSVLRGFTSDTSIALVIDSEHAIRIQPLRELEKFDSIEVLERAAERNTWQELLDAEADATTITTEEGGDGGDFWAFESSSYYLGSAPLFLTDLLQRWAPELDQSRGVIFAIPDRDLLIARPVTTGENLMNGITAMVRIAMRFGLGNPTSISPRLHLLRENAVTTFTDYRVIDPESGDEIPEGTPLEQASGAIGIEIRPDAYLMEMLQQDGFGDFGDFGENRRDLDL